MDYDLIFVYSPLTSSRCNDRDRSMVTVVVVACTDCVFVIEPSSECGFFLRISPSILSGTKAQQTKGSCRGKRQEVQIMKILGFFAPALQLYVM